MAWITYISSILTIILVYISYRIFAKPILSLAPYRKIKHVRVRIVKRGFLPDMKSQRRLAAEKGDYFYDQKQIIREDPECRAVVSINGPLTHVHLVDPNLIKEFFHLQSLYTKRLGGRILKVFLQNGLFSAEGDIWKKHRKIDSQAFHFNFIKDQVPEIRSIAREFIARVPDNSEISAINFFQDMTGEVVGRIFFGNRFSDQKLDGESLCLVLGKLISDTIMNGLTPLHILLGNITVKYLPSAVTRDLLDRMDKFKTICRRMVVERREKIKNNEDQASTKDLLYILLKYQEEHPEEHFDDEEIVHEFITFFIAGLDTTGHLLGMTSYYVSKNPEIKKKMLSELQTVFGSQMDTEMSYDNIGKLDYMLAVLNEALRMAPPAPSIALRVASSDHMLGDIPIKSKCLVSTGFLMNFFNEKYFKNPYEFNPDRWRGANGKTVSSHPENPFIFTPFSAGPRNCIGQHMALLEAKIILAEFVNEFEFHVPEDYVLKMTRRFLYEPLEELKLIVSRRQKIPLNN